MMKLLALAGIAAMLAACAHVQEPQSRQAMGAGAAQPADEAAAIAASLGFHGPRRRDSAQGAD